MIRLSSVPIALAVLAALAPTAAAQRMAQRNRLAELRGRLEEVQRATARAAADHGELESAVEQAAAAERGAREAEGRAFEAVTTARQHLDALVFQPLALLLQSGLGRGCSRGAR